MRPRGRSMLILVTALVILAALCTVPLPVEAKPEGVLKQAIHVSISADWLDPSIAPNASSAQIPLYLLHDALLKPMPEGTFTPCVAESWKVTADAKMYEFSLRKGVKFHNGDPLTAEDVVFSFKRYKGAMAKVIEGRIERFETPNPYQVRIYFKNPYPDLLVKIQEILHDRMMIIPVTNTNSPAAFGPKVKGNPYKIQPLLYFTAPYEDVELVK